MTRPTIDESMAQFVEFATLMNYPQDELANIVCAIADNNNREVSYIINYLYEQRAYFQTLQKAISPANLMVILSGAQNLSRAYNATVTLSNEIQELSNAKLNIDETLRKALTTCKSDSPREKITKVLHDTITEIYDVMLSYTELCETSTSKFKETANAIYNQGLDVEGLQEIIEERNFIRNLCATPNLIEDQQLQEFLKTAPMKQIKLFASELLKTKVIELFSNLDQLPIEDAAEFKDPQELQEEISMRQELSQKFLEKLEAIPDPLDQFIARSCLLNSKDDLQQLYKSRYFNLIDKTELLGDLNYEIYNKFEIIVQRLKTQSDISRPFIHLNNESDIDEETVAEKSDIPSTAIKPQSILFSSADRKSARVSFSEDTIQID